ncbi:MAG: LCP family protein [Lachnospiraceae bacterium]|nr:LCP family protein [Lachnospiraceae bacterium]
MNEDLNSVVFPVLTDRDTVKGKKRRFRYVLVSIGAFLLVTLVFFLLFKAYQSYGRSRLLEYASENSDLDIISLREDIAEMGFGEEYDELPEGQLVFKGRIFEYNNDILTFLVLGVDSRSGISEEKTPGEGGHADMIALVVLDEKAKSLKMISLSRDTMVPVKTFDKGGFYTGFYEMQLAIQYAYGDGREGSLRLMEEAVSELFYGIPIHGSGAMDWFTIELLNDAADGVTLTVLEDLTARVPTLIKGETVTLKGKEAFNYVQYRDTSISGSNNMRMARQKQYILAFFQQIKDKTRANITFPLRLFGIANDHVVTSITADQIAYLSTAVLGSSFSEQDMVSVAGESTVPDYHEEFRVDEEELIELIIETFYREVDR